METMKFSVGTLESMLQKYTSQYQFASDFTNYVLNCIKSGDIGMPTMEYCRQNFKGYTDTLIKVYHAAFDSFKGVEEIPDSIKVAQGAVLDGFMYMYDAANAELKGICSANPLLLGDEVDGSYDKLLKKIFKKNQEGEIFGYRLDFTYNDYSNTEGEFKIVNHRTVMDEESVVVVPYIVGDVICATVNKLLQGGGMVAFKQTLPNGSVKVRATSNNVEHLKHYSDDPLAVEGLQVEYYPLQGFIYIPSMGAPSTTAMMSRVDFFNLDKIARLKGYEDCRRLGIQKSRDGIDELFKEQAIIQSLAEMKFRDPEEFSKTVKRLPNAGIVIGDVAEEDIGVTTISNYLHTSTRGIENKALKVVKGATPRYELRKALITGESMAIDPKEIRSYLGKSLIKVIWKKANGKYASGVVTNSENILSRVYGKEYFSRYESTGVRISAMVREFEGRTFTIEDLENCLERYGFNRNLALDVLENMGDMDLEESMYVVTGSTRRTSSYSDITVTARTIDGYLIKEPEGSVSEFKSYDYYTSIDLSHVVRAIVIA